MPPLQALSRRLESQVPPEVLGPKEPAAQRRGPGWMEKRSPWLGQRLLPGIWGPLEAQYQLGAVSGSRGSCAAGMALVGCLGKETVARLAREGSAQNEIMI